MQIHIFTKNWNDSRFNQNLAVILTEAMYLDRRHPFMQKKELFWPKCHLHRFCAKGTKERNCNQQNSSPGPKCPELKKSVLLELTGSAVITHDVTTGTGYCLVGFNWIIDFFDLANQTQRYINFEYRKINNHCFSSKSIFDFFLTF